MKSELLTRLLQLISILLFLSSLKWFKSFRGWTIIRIWGTCKQKNQQSKAGHTTVVFFYPEVPSIVASNTALYCWMLGGVKVTTANAWDWLGTLRVVATKSNTSPCRKTCKEKQDLVIIYDFPTFWPNKALKVSPWRRRFWPPSWEHREPCCYWWVGSGPWQSDQQGPCWRWTCSHSGRKCQQRCRTVQRRAGCCAGTDGAPQRWRSCLTVCLNQQQN